MTGFTDDRRGYDVFPATGQHSATLTKSDATIYSPPYDALYVAADGGITLTCVSGQTTTFPNAKAGTIIPQAFTKLMSTGTDGTGHVGMRYAT